MTTTGFTFFYQINSTERDKMFRNFDEIIKKAATGKQKIIAVAAANDVNTLSTFALAHKKGLARGILVGDKEVMERIARENDIDLSSQEIIHIPDDKEASLKACSLVKEGKADVLMKGMVKTSTFLKAVLDKDCGLRSGKLLSHVFIFEDSVNKQLTLLTDGGINIKPTLDEKAEIIKNSVALYKKMGGQTAKVAVLAAVEMVNEKMPETVDGAKLQEMAEAGELGDCFVQGPLALDNAISKEAVKIKKLSGDVVGSANILLAPDIASGNLLGKSLIYYGNAANAGTVVGTTAPVIFLSRADNEETKLNSIALCLAIS
jgi:phosphate butyryltransferase